MDARSQDGWPAGERWGREASGSSGDEEGLVCSSEQFFSPLLPARCSLKLF
ncbi:hypothetical protein GQ55_4G014300 [Panicum hallii var. hallii]|uniref:Uncharacterized protein n=1 Tax=Panicum hallii var. hallii TaxID=1504633 RepID=A0A2T7DU53_9POAL|nr:hypothetical protein GQ55_4G014300 [Panicum hallii var. hallii]